MEVIEINSKSVFNNRGFTRSTIDRCVNAVKNKKERGFFIGLCSSKEVMFATELYNLITKAQKDTGNDKFVIEVV
jgi:hypothetical protein